MQETKAAAARMPGADRRVQLIETALEVFSRRGFEGATTKEIAAAAGVTEAVIFRHFPSKQALYQEVLAHQHESSGFTHWMAAVQDCMDRKDDVGLLRAIASVIINTYRKDARCQRVLLFAALEGDEQALAYHRQLSMPTFELLCEYVARRQQDGAFRNLNPAAIVAAIAGMASHFAMMTQLFGFCQGQDDEAAIEAFVNIMMHGIQVPQISRVSVTE